MFNLLQKLYLIFAINAVFDVNNGNISVFLSKLAKNSIFLFFFDGNQRVQLRNIYSKYFPLKVSLWLDTSIMDFVEIAFQ